MRRRHFRLMNARSNPVQTFMSLILVGLMFMFFQASIMKNLQRTQLMLMNSGSEQHNKGKYVAHGKLVHEPLRINPKFASKLKSEQEIGIKVNGTLLRGVKKDQRKFYVPNKEGRFVCLTGNQTIDWSGVNNDFCDCADGSDEPGTSACKNGRFFCEPEVRYIPASMINDGLCDCCDGSDEWKGKTLPSDLELPVDRADIPRAPCKDTCMDYQHQKLHDLNLLKEGYNEKLKLVQSSHQFIGDRQYGSEGEFHYLSTSCHMYKSPGYVYEICPYHNVSQIGVETWLIGTGGELTGNLNHGYELVMDHGARDHCPEGKSRKTILMFNCSPDSKVKYVSEKSPCEYHVKFDTPAACKQIVDSKNNIEENAHDKNAAAAPAAPVVV